MAEVEYSTTAKLPVQTIWDYVHDMDNWAPFLTGYQSHEKQNEDDSEWVLKGDLGAMTRTVKLAVHVTEWAGPERVTFTLKGLNEQVEGRGRFTLAPYENEADAADADTARAPKKNPIVRLIEAVLRFFFRLFRGRAERGADADAGPGAGMSRLTFTLELNAGGPMGPMANAMMKPAMSVAAEDLANRIIGHLEQQRA